MTELVLLQLFSVKLEMETHQSSAEAHRQELDGLRQDEAKIEHDIQSGKIDLAKFSKAVANAEKDVSLKKKVVTELTVQLDTSREKSVSLKKREIVGVKKVAKVCV